MSARPLAAALFLQSGALLLYELLLTRLFAVTLFADFAHLALALALLGIGVGAMAQHLWPTLVPKDGLERRIALLGLLQGALILVAVIAAIRFPVLRVSEIPPTTYQDRSYIKDDLLDPVWFAALLPVLALPFAVAGLAFAGVFSRRKDQVGALYAADLLGAAVGAVVFVPLLTTLAGPDACFVAIAACALSSVVLYAADGDRSAATGSGVAAVASLIATLVAARGDLLPIRNAAGYSEDRVIYTQWTPLTRLAIHRDARGDYMLLDNSSASEILRSADRREKVAHEANRALVYHLYDPPAHIAIIAASAGPEVASAQSLGFTNIDAIDIAGEIFDLVAARYPDDPVNPYTTGDTHRLNSDGRAAILRATEPYDVIQMVHANLWSSAGLMSNAWSPALLETKEAFGTYLDHLSENGTISFGRGDQTDDLVRAAAAALRERGVADPRRHIAYVSGQSRVMLVRKHPWTAAERDALVEAMSAFGKATFVLDPTADPAPREWKKILDKQPAMTDDHPYADSPATVGTTLGKAFAKASGQDTEPIAALYRSIVVQCGFVLAAGLLFVGVPLAWRGRSELGRVPGSAALLGYTACIGYGYLSIETVLIHHLVLFVGHPTYAVTVVVLAMLLFSGLGSFWAGGPRTDGDVVRLRILLGSVVVLGALIAFAVIPILYASLLWLPLIARAAIVGITLAPLGFAMGTAFPLGIRAMPDAGAAVIPWAWAINGWTSVLGSLATVLVARLWGYSDAFAVALVAYVVAALLAGRLTRVGTAGAGAGQ
jgi:hypothetical protein